MDAIKRLLFMGGSLDDLRRFPREARSEAGFQLDQIQHGREADDWKPMSSVGAGVKEVRVKDKAGIFRVVYVAKFAEAVYVLHCFQKKAQQTSKPDIEMARARYKELLREIS